MPVSKAAAASSKRSSAQGGPGTVSVHKSLYPNEVLFGTAFAFLDRCYVHLDVEGTDRISIELLPRPGSTWTQADLAGEFKNELVNQALRFRLAKQTEKVRTMIVGRAIGEAIPAEVSTNQSFESRLPDLPPEVARLLAEEEDGLDFLDDPLGIAVPWEEKYSKKPAESPTAEAAQVVAQPVEIPAAVAGVKIPAKKTPAKKAAPGKATAKATAKTTAKTAPAKPAAGTKRRSATGES